MRRTEMNLARWTAALVASLSSACTTLGPVPVVSGQSMAANTRTNVEVQAAAVPGYYLSSSTSDGQGASQRQVATMFEPGDLLPLEGFSAGGRWVAGGDEGGHFEPMLRYRTAVDPARSLGLGAVMWGAKHEGQTDGASYDALRAGAEVGTDVRLTPRWRWVELHWMAALSLTALSASGSYCADAHGKGTDCNTTGLDPRHPNATAHVAGLYPAGMLGLALDIANGFDGPFHGIRAFAMGGSGWMPRVRADVSPDRTPFHAFGIGLQAAVGAPKP